MVVEHGAAVFVFAHPLPLAVRGEELQLLAFIQHDDAFAVVVLDVAKGKAQRVPWTKRAWRWSGSSANWSVTAWIQARSIFNSGNGRREYGFYLP